MASVKEQLELALTSTDSEALAALAESDSTSHSDEIREAVANNPAAMSTVLAWCTAADNIAVLKAVAEHPNTDRETLFQILFRMEGRWANLLTNPPTPEAMASMEEVIAVQEVLWYRLGKCTPLESLKAVRALLKVWFPGVNFLVRMVHSDGLQDVVIRWVDGPQPIAVRAAIRLFVSLSDRVDWEPFLGSLGRAVLYRQTTA